MDTFGEAAAPLDFDGHSASSVVRQRNQEAFSRSRPISARRSLAEILNDDLGPISPLFSNQTRGSSSSNPVIAQVESFRRSRRSYEEEGAGEYPEASPR